GTLAAGASDTLTLVVSPGAADVPTLVEQASVSATETDPQTSNNSARISTTAPPVAALGVTLAASPMAVDVGGTLKYTVTLTNNGPSTATAIKLTDALPAGVTFVSASD